MKHKNQLLKVFSLGVGIAISFVLIAKVCFESSYDSFYKDIDRIYQIYVDFSYGGQKGNYPNVSGAIAPGIKQYAPGVEAATRTTGLFESDNYLLEDKSVVSGHLVLADSSFFQVFNREIYIGNPSEILNTPGQIMVSRSFAEKLGGIEKAVGQKIANETMPYLKLTIAGVYEDFPKNGTLDYDILFSLASYTKRSTENWVGNDRYYGYVKLQEGVNPTSLKDGIRLMQEKHQAPLLEREKEGDFFHLFLKPFSKLHTSDSVVKNMILILSIVALILLVISMMNYSLITVSEIVKRAKEMGVHKCYGAEGWDIYRILIKETGVTLLLSLLLAVILVFAAQPLIQDLMNVKLAALFIPQTWVVLGLMLVVIVLVSIFIPGYLYNHVPVSIVFRNLQMNKRHWKLTLLTVQFIINVFMFGFMFVIAAQYHKVLNDDKGYNDKNVFYYNTAGAPIEQVTRAIEQLKTMPEVTDVERCYALPFQGSSGNNIFLPGQDKELFNIADQYLGTEGIFDFFEIPILEGRVPKTEKEVAVSRSFISKMNDFADWSDGAIGKQICISEHSKDEKDLFTITGVYEDYLIGTQTWRETRPSIRFTAGMDRNDYMSYTLIKLQAKDAETLEKVRNLLKSCITDKNIEVLSYEDEMVKLYDDNMTLRNTIIVGCFFAIVIAFLGLIGYIRDESLRRSKEIAIRKINGAVTSEIMGLFVKDIMKLVLIAIVIGDVAAYYISSLWLELFVDKIDWLMVYLLAGDCIVAFIVLITVLLNCLKITRANPVLSLKSE